MYIQLLFILVLNIISFSLYGIDKKKSIEHQWRISEANLLIIALIAPFGAFLGMKHFHHKTKKNKFKLSIPFFMALHIAIIIYLQYNYNLFF